MSINYVFAVWGLCCSPCCASRHMQSPNSKMRRCLLSQGVTKLECAGPLFLRKRAQSVLSLRRASLRCSSCGCFCKIKCQMTPKVAALKDRVTEGLLPDFPSLHSFLYALVCVEGQQSMVVRRIDLIQQVAWLRLSQVGYLQQVTYPLCASASPTVQQDRL